MVKGLHTEYSITDCKTTTVKDSLSSLLTSDVVPKYSVKKNKFATKKRGKERKGGYLSYIMFLHVYLSREH